MNGNVSHYMWDVSKAGIFFSQETAFAKSTQQHAVP